MAEELLADAERHLDRALDAHAVDSMRFLRAEIKTVIHRLRSCRRVVRGSDGKDAAFTIGA